MKDIGLLELQLIELKEIFKKHPDVKKVKIYGSRTKGTFHERSDIDLVVFGENIDRFLIAQILIDLDDSTLPYAVDLQNFHDLKNLCLIDHINRVGITLYQTDAAI